MSAAGAQLDEFRPPRRLRASPLATFLSLNPSATSLERLRSGVFDSGIYAHLQSVADTFAEGYNEMFRADPIGRLEHALARTPLALQGFLVEGAAMGAMIRDALRARPVCTEQLCAAYGDRFGYLIQVGAGWALARMPWLGRRLFRTLPPDLYALSLDGRGFHDAFFRPERHAGGALARGSGLAARAYDQGIGRALWFVSLGRAELALAHVATFAPARRGDLASGLGLAMAYAGPASEQTCLTVLESLPEHRNDIAQGVIFAAAAHAAACHRSPNLERVCRLLAGMTIAEASAFADQTRPDQKPATRAQALALYQCWRRATQDKIASASSGLQTGGHK